MVVDRMGERRALAKMIFDTVIVEEELRMYAQAAKALLDASQKT